MKAHAPTIAGNDGYSVFEKNNKMKEINHRNKAKKVKKYYWR